MSKNVRKNKNLLRINKTELNVYKKLIHEVFGKFDGVKEVISQKIEEICCQENLSVEEVIYFVDEGLGFVVSF